MRGELATSDEGARERRAARVAGVGVLAPVPVARSGYADTGRGVRRVMGTRGAWHQQQRRKR